ncbi:MAG: hypothetical protein JWM58_976 [Rhizobium sp.]|nr:hypothetical protein [Rhizobium sp.]
MQFQMILSRLLATTANCSIVVQLAVQIANFREEIMTSRFIHAAWTIAAFSVLSLAASAADMKLPDIKAQPSAQAVLDEHLAALNVCDWNRLVAQYPEDAQINLPGGAIAKGRAAIGDLFAGLCKDHKDGGLNGIHFEIESSVTIGDTFVSQWVATAPFLAEPYKGSDAYITKDGLMQAMVSTFDGGALKMK